jgi:hypothetical protein
MVVASRVGILLTIELSPPPATRLVLASRFFRISFPVLTNRVTCALIDRIRDGEVLEWQIGRQIRVSEVGFDGSDGCVFETALLAVHRRQFIDSGR